MDNIPVLPVSDYSLKQKSSYRKHIVEKQEDHHLNDEYISSMKGYEGILLEEHKDAIVRLDLGVSLKELKDAIDC